MFLAAVLFTHSLSLKVIQFTSFVLKYLCQPVCNVCGFFKIGKLSKEMLDFVPDTIPCTLVSNSVKHSYEINVEFGYYCHSRENWGWVDRRD